jgi:copper homeostasis protein
MRKIEVCCSSLKEVLEAERAGAFRVELCGAIALGGITPSFGVIRSVVEAVKTIKVNVLIRVREGGFCYTDEEVEAMCRDIEFCREVGVDGVVIGALTTEGEIDIVACRKMMAAAEGMSVTFHRAFDVCRNGEKALEDIISLGCDRLLTSGMEQDAEQGAKHIAEFVEQAAGRIIIMPGAGIRPNNIAWIEKMTAATEFHSTAAANIPDQAFATKKLSFAADSCGVGLLRRSQYEIVSELVNNTL